MFLEKAVAGVRFGLLLSSQGTCHTFLDMVWWSEMPMSERKKFAALRPRVIPKVSAHLHMAGWYLQMPRYACQKRNFRHREFPYNRQRAQLLESSLTCVKLRFSAQLCMNTGMLVCASNPRGGGRKTRKLQVIFDYLRSYGQPGLA